MNEEAIQRQPVLSWLNHNAMGEAALRIGDNLRAEQAFSRVIELEPDNVQRLQQSGSAIYLHAGSAIPQAASAFQRSD